MMVVGEILGGEILGGVLLVMPQKEQGSSWSLVIKVEVSACYLVFIELPPPA